MASFNDFLKVLAKETSVAIIKQLLDANQGPLSSRKFEADVPVGFVLPKKKSVRSRKS